MLARLFSKLIGRDDREAGPSVPLAAKANCSPGGYISHPEGTDEVLDHCGDCRTIWPATSLTFDKGADDWFCAPCLAAQDDREASPLADREAVRTVEAALGAFL